MTRNVEMIEFVARSLGDLRDEVVFLGGAVAALLITDPGAAAVRFTLDVDVIVDVGSKVAYDRLSEKLRGRGDYRGSHDLEDVVAVVDGREEIVNEARRCPNDLRSYLADRIDKLLASKRFIEALPGHLPGDAASQGRMPIIVRRLSAIAGRG